MPKFIEPKISKKNYMKLSGPEFDDLCNDALQCNKEWFRETTGKNPHAVWILVLGNKAIEVGYKNIVPSVTTVREHSQGNKKAYLLVRPQRQYQDLMLFFREKTEGRVLDALHRERSDLKYHLDESEGMQSMYVQSGLLNKLHKQFALGSMELQAPLTGKKKEIKHVHGAYVAHIRNKEYQGKHLAISSQSKKDIHARGSKTIDEKLPDQWMRIERLHRFDDPVLDIFDTYETRGQRKWPELVLYKPRNKQLTL